MDKFITLFQRLGIPEKTARIYLDLLTYGSSSISEMSLRTTLHRPEIYRSLPFLIEERLIEETLRWKRSFYKALSPDRIEALIREFEQKNEPIVAELKNQYERLEKNISVSYQEGKAGVSRVFDDIVDSLPKWAIFYRISAENDVERANTYVPKDYREKRDKKQLERIVISSNRAATVKQKRLERDILIIPKEYDLFDQDVTMTVYGDKMAYIDFSNESSIIIENPMIADFQKKLFILLQKLLERHWDIGR